MKISRAIMISSVLAAAVYPSVADAQVDQRALSRQVLSGDVAARSEAVEAARGLGPANTEAELRAALITALEREAAAHSRRYESGRRGEMMPPLEDPELIGALSRVVARLEDPRAIPAMAAALGTGFTVIRALAAFAEEAAPAVLDVVTSRESLADAVNHGLITLRFIVETGRQHPLSPRITHQIARAAEQRLNGNQHFTTLWWAIDLAVVLEDPELTRIVESLAESREEVIRRGIEKPELILETQRIAASRLAGDPPLPRR